MTCLNYKDGKVHLSCGIGDFRKKLYCFIQTFCGRSKNIMLMAVLIVEGFEGNYTSIVIKYSYFQQKLSNSSLFSCS